MKLEGFGILLGLAYAICTVPSLTVSYPESRSEPQSRYDNMSPQVMESFIQNEEGEPSEDFKKEINKQFAKQRGDQPLNVKAESDKVIRQGDAVALQTDRRNFWMSCWEDRCGTSNCPRAFFDARDSKACLGESFQIYRTRPGEIKSGDLVGLHYPHQRGFWLACSSTCGKSSCPGQPTNAIGFSHEHKWFQCFGEVYRIFVYGKSVGSHVMSGDSIALYYVQEKTWLNGGGDKIVKNPCIGPAPPSPSQYDPCAHEIFIIVKRPLSYHARY